MEKTCMMKHSKPPIYMKFCPLEEGARYVGMRVDNTIVRETKTDTKGKKSIVVKKIEKKFLTIEAPQEPHWERPYEQKDLYFIVYNDEDKKAYPVLRSNFNEYYEEVEEESKPKKPSKKVVSKPKKKATKSKKKVVKKAGKKKKVAKKVRKVSKKKVAKKKTKKRR